MEVPFPEWLPDLGEYTPGASVIENVISQADFYVPFPSPVPLYDALPSRCLGAQAFRGLNRIVETLAATATSVYRGEVGGTGFSWELLSNTYSANPSNFDYWEFVQWQNRAFLTNFVDPIQQYGIGTGAALTDLIATIQARHIAATRDFVLVGDIDDENGEQPNRVRWCAYRNPDDWVPNVDTQAGFVDLEGDAGKIQRIVGGEIPVILRENAIHRFIYEGGARVWQNDRFLEGLGTPASRSVVKVQEDIYFLSDSGFHRLEGGVRPDPIGRDKVDQTFFNWVNNEQLPGVQAAYYPRTKVVIWSFASGSSSLPDTHFLFNLVTRRWTYVKLNLETLFVGASPGYTLEDLDPIYPDGIETIPGSLDSQAWLGTAGLFLGFNPTFQASELTGPPLRARLSTGEFSPFAGWRFSPHDIRPIIHSTQEYQSLLFWAEYHNKEWEPHRTTAARSPTDGGNLPLRLEARYQRYFADFQFLTGFEAKGITLDVERGGFR